MGKLWFAALAAVLSLAPPAAGHVEACGPADEIERSLKKKFGEARVAVALSQDGSLIERWESEAGTWSLLRRTRDGEGWRLCLFLAGDNWRGVPPELQGTAL